MVVAVVVGSMVVVVVGGMVVVVGPVAVVVLPATVVAPAGAASAANGHTRQSSITGTVPRLNRRTVATDNFPSLAGRSGGQSSENPSTLHE